jgi:hypothetical protein
MTLELEINRYYQSRKRGIVHIVGEYTKKDELFRIFGYAFVGKVPQKKDLVNYLPNGRAINDTTDDPLDLLEETHKPMPPEPLPAKPERPKIGPRQKLFLEAVLYLKDDAFGFRIYEYLKIKHSRSLRLLAFSDISSTVAYHGWVNVKPSPKTQEGSRADRRFFTVTPAGHEILKAVEDYTP